ncbi:hypothetical protein ACX80S_18170 [Arthrobacter sp. RHLT1-20]
MALRQPLAKRLVDAASDALTTADAPVVRQVLATDLGLLQSRALAGWWPRRRLNPRLTAPRAGT